MFDDEDLPKKPAPMFAPAKLDGKSVEEMRDYIADLKAEIPRVEAEINKRGGHKNAAESLFKNK